jgi:MFS family permease
MGYLPLYLRDRGWSNVAADASLAVYNAAGTAASVPLTLMSDRLGKRKAILVPSLVISTLGIGLLGFTSGAPFWLVVVVTGAFRDMIWAMAATMTVESEGIGPGYAGTAVGIVHAFTRFGYTYAPAAGKPRRRSCRERRSCSGQDSASWGSSSSRWQRKPGGEDSCNPARESQRTRFSIRD